MTTITLTREHRDAIYDEIESLVHLGDDLPLYLEGAEFEQKDREWIRWMGWRISVCAHLLDQLGWRKHGDRCSYQLEVNADVAKFMERLDRRSRADLENDCCVLAEGRDSYARYGVVFSDEEWTREVTARRRLVDSDLDARAAAQLALDAYRKEVT